MNTRFDCSSFRSTFIDRKPTAIHEMMIRSLDFEIISQLKEAAHEDGNVKIIIDSIINTGSGDVELEGFESIDPIKKTYLKQSPDCSYGHFSFVILRQIPVSPTCLKMFKIRLLFKTHASNSLRYYAVPRGSRRLWKLEKVFGMFGRGILKGSFSKPHLIPKNLSIYSLRIPCLLSIIK